MPSRPGADVQESSRAPNLFRDPGRSLCVQWFWNGVAWGALSGLAAGTSRWTQGINDALPQEFQVAGIVPPLLFLACGVGWARAKGERPLLGLLVMMETTLLTMMAAASALHGEPFAVSFSGTWWKVPLGILAMPVVLPLQAAPVAIMVLASGAAGWAYWSWADRRMRAASVAAR
jgi:hypothetical protein